MYWILENIKTNASHLGRGLKTAVVDSYVPFHSCRLALTTFVSCFTAVTFLVALYGNPLDSDLPDYEQINYWLKYLVPFFSSLVFTNYLTKFLEDNNYSSKFKGISAAMLKASRFTVSATSGIAGIYKIFAGQPTTPKRDDISYSNAGLDTAFALFSVTFAVLIWFEASAAIANKSSQKQAKNAIRKIKKILQNLDFQVSSNKPIDQNEIYQLTQQLANLLANKEFFAAHGSTVQNDIRACIKDILDLTGNHDVESSAKKNDSRSTLKSVRDCLESVEKPCSESTALLGGTKP